MSKNGKREPDSLAVSPRFDNVERVNREIEAHAQLINRSNPHSSAPPRIREA